MCSWGSYHSITSLVSPYAPSLCRERLRALIPAAVRLLPFAFMVGSSVVIMPQFEPEAFFRNIEKYEVTMSLVVPPMFLTILRHSGARCARKVNYLFLTNKPPFPSSDEPVQLENLTVAAVRYKFNLAYPFTGCYNRYRFRCCAPWAFARQCCSQ